MPLDQPRGLAHLPFGVIVIARRLWDGAMLRLLHCFRQSDAAPGSLGEVAGAQPMRGKFLRIEPGQGDAPLQDEIDRLRGQRAVL